MRAAKAIAASRNTRLPYDVFASHVEALYSDASSLTVGIFAAFLTTLSTGLIIHDKLIVGIAFALAALGLARLRFMRHFWEVRPRMDEASLHRWEQGYVLGGSLHLALLGSFCLAAFTRSNDAFAWLASLSITMAYLIGTPGRSFASNLLVDAQILVSALPLTASLMFAGLRYAAIVLFVIVPFMVALKTISARLRGIFHSAVLRARDLSILADRFDTALTNMPHGLAMFDADGHITVENAQFGVLLDAETTSKDERRVTTLLGAFETGETAFAALKHFDGTGSPSDAPSPSQRWVSTRRDGCSIAFTLQGMSDGGGVLIVQDVTEQVRAEASLAFLARFDKLTGLRNRHGFQEIAGTRLQANPEQPSVLMFIDLDRFKNVNDTLGHAMGDRLLRAVAERLRTATHPNTLLARFGGDEFVLHHWVDDVRLEGSRIAARIIARLSEPFEIEGHHILIGASIGLAASAGGAAEVETLLRDADLALYRAKAAQRGTFQFFEGEMQASATARRELEADMRTAIERGQMTLHFQPMTDVTRNVYTTCEALLRWNHPKRGFVPPMDFIAIAEDTGFIRELGEWVLKQACLECARWPEDIGVAVNVSALQFQRGDLPEVALRAAIEAGLSPRRLEIEITETALLQDLDEARTTLLRLRHFGFRLALDDFGTGYSSLSYIRLLPFDKVKLDRSFLTDKKDDGRALKVIQNVARLCADLGMSVVMEGVETPDQLDAVVQQAGIREVQGYLTGRPMPAERLRWLLEHPDEARPSENETRKQINL